jgi:glycosyltransferase involved in cell wall biosynthesis
MRVGLFTREFPPQVYGGAGVHVDYLSRELAKEIVVEVHCWGPQKADNENLYVRGSVPWEEITNGTEGKFKNALEALSLNLTQVKALSGIDIVHTHTWYTSMAGYWAKKLYNIPFVLTTHSLEPLRAWKAEQLGSGYAMSSWMERTAIVDADAIIAVSQGTKTDILRVYPDVLWGRYDRALCLVRRPCHSTEGRNSSGRCNSLLAAGDAGSALCWGTGYSRDSYGVETEGRELAPRAPAACLDRKNGDQAGGNPTIQPCARFLLPLDLRTVRNHQPRSDVLPRARSCKRYRRDQRGRR